MAIEIVTLPCLEDNYAYIIHDPVSTATALVDVADHEPILAELDRRGWRLTDVWITHHHWDHVDGLAPLLDALAAKGIAPLVTAAAADMHRMPEGLITDTVEEGSNMRFGDHPVQVFDVSGHTINHIAFYLAAANAAFTADSLMALGCGRLFEGTPAQMWKSLQKLRVLPPETVICSGHEYTASNAKFALTIEPDNSELTSRVRAVTAARDKGVPTVPSLLSDEINTNPFLRADHPDLQHAVGMAGANASEVFAHVRRAKDQF